MTDPARLKPGELVRAVNVDIHNDGMLSQRGGTTRVFSGRCRSVFGSSQGLLFAEEENLYLMNADHNAKVMRADLDPSLPLTYAEVAGEVLYSNTVITGSIRQGQSEPWGPPTPDAPMLSMTPSGRIPPGRYRAVVTFFDAAGRESGASESSNVVEFKEVRNGLSVRPPAMSDGVYGVGVYLSSGTNFFRVGLSTSCGEVRVDVFNQADHLKSQFFETAPPGHIIRFYRGRVYVATDNLVFYSEPAPNFHHFSDENVFQFDGKVLLMEPVADGIYVADHDTFFLSGTDPEEMTINKVGQARVVPGSSVVIDAKHLGVEKIQGPVAAWFTEKDGLIVGLSNMNGDLLQLTSGRFAIPDGLEGMGMAFRQYRGINQLVTAFRTGLEDQRMGASDKVSSEVIMRSNVMDSFACSDTVTITVNGIV
ncbi:MAG: hypothetical protein HQL95_00635 [Magnetococcales bacterium]|nr:hypothetical protein [Magnetococcales bacterium]